MAATATIKPEGRALLHAALPGLETVVRGRGRGCRGLGAHRTAPQTSAGVHRPPTGVRTRFVRAVGPDGKLEALRVVLQRAKEHRVMVFCNEAKTCEWLGYQLAALYRGRPTCVLHGDLAARERRANYADFLAGEDAVLVATDCGSRGLDVPGVRHVVLYDFPGNASAAPLARRCPGP